MNQFKIGHGYDVHRLTPERKLILGGVEIPNDMGLLGHSDADVLLHAVCDAVLGALGKGDIGKHFPDSDEKYRGISSLMLLNEVCNIMKVQNFCIGNIDVTLIAQKPKIAPYINQMTENIASVFSCSKESVNIKATTEEGLGFTGSYQGIACHAVALLEHI